MAASLHAGSRRTIALALVFVPLQAGLALAAELPRPDEATDVLAPQRLAAAHPRWTAEHRREGAVLGEFLAWPAMTVGAVFDTNPYQQHRAAHAATGLALAPVILLERDAGIHRTAIYGAGDIRLFPDRSGADLFSGRAGVLHDWALRRDLTLRLQAEVSRRTDPFDNAALLAGAPRPGLISETSRLGAASLQKSFDRLFVSLSSMVLRSTYDAPRSSAAAAGVSSLSGETTATLKGRVGYILPSSLYVFAEPAADWRALDRVPRTSAGTRAVAGVGVLRLGLLSGEVFGGRQEQSYPFRTSSLSMPVVGGRLAWAPTRAWTVAAQFDETLGDVAVATVADPLGTPVRTRTALATVRCALSPLWRARAEAGAIWADYVGTLRDDRLLFADVRVDYAMSRSIDLTGVLRLSDLSSSIAPASYRRTAATLAATYHY